MKAAHAVVTIGSYPRLRRPLSRLALLLSALALSSSLWLSPREGDAQSARRVVIGASGDILIHLRVIAAAEAAPEGWDRVFGELSRVIGPDEIAFANLETPLSTERTPQSGSPPVLGAPPEVAASLARAGFDALSFANNHAYDQRAVGATRTVEAVRAAGLGVMGAGPTEEDALAPWITEQGGVRVAFLAITERINGGPGARRPETVVARWEDDREIGRAVEAARASADVVVVSVHWSHDFWREPTGQQRERARFLVEHGADLILGTGPHVLQEVERIPSPRGEAVCAYSLGNLVSNQGFRHRVGHRSDPGANPATVLAIARDGVWLRTAISLEGDRVHIDSVEGVPLYTYNNFWARETRAESSEDIRVRRLADFADPELIANRRPEIAAALGPLVTLID